MGIVEYRKALEKKFSLYKVQTLLNFKWHRRKILKSIDRKKFQALINLYKDVAPDPGYSKYLNIDFWITRNLWHAYILGLNQSGPKNILDIGTGNGYFPYICKYFGHTVRTIDIWTDPMFNDLIKFLQIPRIDFEIKPFEPLPDFEIKFDLVTGFMVCFNGHKTPALWGPKQWDYFLNNIANNLTNPDAQAYFSLNAEPDGLFYTKELYDFFVEKDAEVDEKRIYFPSLNQFKQEG